MIQIDKDIPMPSTKGRIAKYPWSKMEVGDSFFVPNAGIKKINPYGAEKKTGFKFSCRAMDGGVRVWRTS